MIQTSMQGVGYGSDSVGSGARSSDKRASDDLINAACYCQLALKLVTYLRMVKD